MKVIYDLGSNNGDDLEYYLLKADRVVAVEANPDLCKIIETRFSREIADSRLFVENCAITDKEADNVDFYIHQRYHFLGSLIPPEQNSFDWRKISIGALPLHHLISKHGQPYYIKIDLEGCDELALHALLNCNTKPQYISAESHTIGVFALLAEKLGYRSFKLGNLWATGVLALFEAGKASFDLAWTLRLLPGRATDSFQRHLAGI